VVEQHAELKHRPLTPPFGGSKREKSMDIPKIDHIAFENMAHSRPDKNREPGFILHHGRRTAQIALFLAEQININVPRDILYTGALFHDVGKGTEPHHKIGARIVQDLLSDLCSEDELNRICEIVRLHHQRGKSNIYAPEIKLVQDADYLDHVGPLGPWLAFYRSGIHAETIQSVLSFVHSDERAGFLSLMRKGLNYDISVNIFDQRVDFEERFFDEFERVQREGL
jgi:uncharacterized protein